MKLVIVLMTATFLLTACGNKKPPEVQVDFNGPTSGPDWDSIKPTYGPNDPY